MKQRSSKRLALEMAATFKPANGLVNMAPILQAMMAWSRQKSQPCPTRITHHFHWFFIFAVMMLMLGGLMSSDMFFRTKFKTHERQESQRAFLTAWLAGSSATPFLPKT